MKDYIKYFYENYNEDRRLTSKSHMPEYLTTMRYIEKYLTSNSKILEIGAGTLADIQFHLPIWVILLMR